MDVLVSLLHGLANIFTPVNFAVLVIGLVLGMLVAVLPGLTLVMGVVLALPFTYKMGVGPALILLTAMYVVRHVRRRDHLDPVPHSRRADGRAAAVGRLRDDAPGPGGAGARLVAGRRARRRAAVRGGHGGADRSRSRASR